MEIADFVIVGSSGGGGTISWLLAKAGFKVVMVEQGADIAQPLADTAAAVKAFEKLAGLSKRGASHGNR